MKCVLGPIHNKKNRIVDFCITYLARLWVSYVQLCDVVEDRGTPKVSYEHGLGSNGHSCFAVINYLWTVTVVGLRGWTRDFWLWAWILGEEPRDACFCRGHSVKRAFEAVVCFFLLCVLLLGGTRGVLGDHRETLSVWAPLQALCIIRSLCPFPSFSFPRRGKARCSAS